jgi:hypothetical protein
MRRDLSPVRVGETSTAAHIGITNLGQAPISLGQVQMTGANSSEFEIVEDRLSNQTLARGATRSVAVALSPRSPRMKVAALSLRAPDGVQKVDLAG